MNFKAYATLSPAVTAQIRQVVDIWRDHLRGDLLGVYIHGSIALGCFVEGVSDIDILVVSNRKIGRGERLALAKDIMELNGKPSPLEM